jgi:uncharacterized membrane protein
MPPDAPPKSPDRAARIVLDWLLLATFLTCACGYWFKAQCMTAEGWSNAHQYTTGCYSDAVPFWGGREVGAGKVPYLQTRMEYPVLTGALIYVDGRLTAALYGKNAGMPGFLLVVTAINTLLALIVTLLLWRMGLPKVRLWMWALAPPLVLYVGHNWDLLAITFAIGAMLLADRGRLASACALAALGTAAKLFPVFLLPLLALRPLMARDFARVARLVAVSIAVWGVVNVPIAIAAWNNWSEFFRFSSERSGTAASFWSLGEYFGWFSGDDASRNLWSGLLFLAGYGAIVAFGWRRHAERPWRLFGPVIAWFLLTSKVWSPQFDLWLYPLLVIACPSVWPILLFIVGDIAAYFAEFWWFAGLEGAHPSATQGAILMAALIRAVALLWAIIAIVRWPYPDNASVAASRGPA